MQYWDWLTSSSRQSDNQILAGWSASANWDVLRHSTSPTVLHPAAIKLCHTTQPYNLQIDTTLSIPPYQAIMFCMAVRTESSALQHTLVPTCLWLITTFCLLSSPNNNHLPTVPRLCSPPAECGGRDESTWSVLTSRRTLRHLSLFNSEIRQC